MVGVQSSEMTVVFRSSLIKIRLFITERHVSADVIVFDLPHEHT